jgi:hypothetical protein
MNNETTHKQKIRVISSIRAVAKNTVKQALRMKVAAVFVILLLVLLPVLGLTVTGDETIKGRLQTFVGYGLSLTSFLLCLLTIIISIYTITSDIKYKQIHSIITKPIRRYQLLIGKMLGVLMLDMVLLLVFSVIIYAIAIYLPVFFNAQKDEIVQLNNEFFTARLSIPMPQADVTEKVRQRYSELEKLGRLPLDYSKQQVIEELTNQELLASRAAEPGHHIVWEFENLKPVTSDFFIRFKYEVPDNGSDEGVEIHGEWVVGDPEYIRHGRPIKTPIYDAPTTSTPQTFHELTIPAVVIPESRRLAVAFVNDSQNNTSVMFQANGVSLLYKAGSFTANFARSVLLIFLRLIFLTSLATLLSTFVSFPVAILVSLVIFATVTVSGFIIESLSSLKGNVGILYTYSIKLLVQILPAFDKFNPSAFMINAQLLSWFALGKFALFMVGIPSVLLLAVAFFIFSRREIAKIII